MWEYMRDGHGGWGWFGGMGMLLFWVLVLLGVLALGKWLFAGGLRSSAPGTALDILNERYARGEIGREEFEQKRKDLTGGP
jgi:putative membrane protein